MLFSQQTLANGGRRIFLTLLATALLAQGSSAIADPPAWVSPELMLLFPSITPDEWSTLELDDSGRFNTGDSMMGAFNLISARNKLNGGVLGYLRGASGAARAPVARTIGLLERGLGGEASRVRRLEIGFRPGLKGAAQFKGYPNTYTLKNQIVINPAEIGSAGLEDLNPAASLQGTVAHEGMHYHQFIRVAAYLKSLKVSSGELERILETGAYYTEREELNASMMGNLATTNSPSISRALASIAVRRYDFTPSGKLAPSERIAEILRYIRSNQPIPPSTTRSTGINLLPSALSPRSVFTGSRTVGLTIAKTAGPALIFGEAAGIVDHALMHRQYLTQVARMAAGSVSMAGAAAGSYVGVNLFLLNNTFPNWDIERNYSSLSDALIQPGESAMGCRKFSTISCHNVWLRGQ